MPIADTQCGTRSRLVRVYGIDRTTSASSSPPLLPSKGFHRIRHTNGMPRMMAAVFPLEFVILPNITYVHFEAFMPRRIYTDGRSFPKDEEPSFMG